MARTKSFSSFQKRENLFKAIPDLPIVSKLPAGVYQFAVNPETGEGFFEAMDMLSDGIVDLPSVEFKTAVSQINKFLQPETRKNYDKFGFLYKRSILLEGRPGTGKSVIVNRIGKEIVNRGGVVIFNPYPNELKLALTYLKDVDKDQMVMVIFEELDQLMEKFEDSLLHILDGEMQVDNIVYLATTNYVEKIPDRILRPGRFSMVINVGFPDENARRSFLKTKLPNPEDQILFGVEDIVRKSEGLSIDELKEVVLSLTCLDGDLDEVLIRVRRTKDEVGVEGLKKNNIDKLKKDSRRYDLAETLREFSNRLNRGDL